MGSPLSPLLAELFLKNLEENTISSSSLFNQFIFTWKRYVDDIFCIFTGNHSELLNFIKWLNTLHKNIKFTFETQDQDGNLPFLDLSLSILNSSLSYNIYRKPTNTTHVIPFHSNHPLQQKLASFRFLFNRLLNVPLSLDSFHKEWAYILSIAKINGFPFILIHNLYKKIRIQHSIKKHSTLTPVSVDTQSAKYLSIPFIPTVSHTIKNHFKNSNIIFSFKTLNTNKTLFQNNLDQIDAMCKSGVYKLNCSCNKHYIGRTFRNFKVRSNKHIKLINNTFNTHQSQFADHIARSGHDFITIPEILHVHDKPHIIDYLEQLYISNHKQHNPDLLLNENTSFNLKFNF